MLCGHKTEGEGYDCSTGFETLGVELHLGEIYRMIKFPAEEHATESGERTA
jgi:hypothetical protein